ncbi:MAG: copper-translocating P-type ATPase [Waddliaceae bacterium]|nr:copper-translocating P-type ATPase [Waddliaceae bacterium]
MKKLRVQIENLHCASCVQGVEKGLSSLDGIEDIQVNLALKEALITYSPLETNASIICKKINNLGFKALPKKENSSPIDELKSARYKALLAGVLAIPLMVISMTPQFHSVWIELSLSSAILLIGYQFFTRGILDLIKRKSATMDTLVAIGVGTAYLSSSWQIFQESPPPYYFETAGMLVFFILLGRYLEARAKGKTSSAIRKLIDLAPQKAIRIKDGVEEECLAKDLRIDDVVLVKAGQKIPADGLVIEGRSTVDESMVSGESLPTEKIEGSNVIGATINGMGKLLIRVKKIGKDSFLQQVIQVVEEAQRSKVPIQKLADQIAAYFVPFVVILAFISLVTWWNMGMGWEFSLQCFVAVLIIACPCSLGLATPTAIIVGTGIGAERGILIRNPSALQAAKKIRTLVFDKTGTVTKGHPQVKEIQTNGISEDDLLSIAASLEQGSAHPLAQAITKEASAKALALQSMKQIKVHNGLGISARKGDSNFYLGNQLFLQEQGIEIPATESLDFTTVYLGQDQQYLGFIACEDSLKPEASASIGKLKSMGMRCLLLSGDRQQVAEAVGQKLGMHEVFAGVLPKNKAAKIQELQSKGKRVAMIGDGINDAPALAQADLSIAVANGSDIAIEAADIVLIRNDLMAIAETFFLSQVMMRKIKQNLFWAFFYNILTLPIAAGVLYPSFGILLHPMIAGAAMAFSSVSVVGNALLMKNQFTKN